MPEPTPLLPVHQWLTDKKACQSALNWVGTRTLKQAWADCEDPQWMLWLLEHLDYKDEQTLRLYACWCATNTPIADGRVTWDLLTDNRSRKAILVAIDFANGEATAEELAAAGAAAGDAAWAAGAAGAARAARDAAWAAVWAARDAAGDAAKMAQANELRRRVPYSVVAKLARKAGIKCPS